jgi:hypothetical protein
MTLATDRFADLGAVLSEARSKLALQLEWSPETGRPLGDHDPSIEATAKRFIDTAAPGEGVELARLYGAYIEAVNALWLLAEREGVTEQLVREFVRANRRNINDSGVERADLSSEATLAMREQVIRWACSDRRRPLAIYARPGIAKTLHTFLGREADAASGFGHNAASIRSKRSNRVALEDEGNEPSNQ